MGVGRFISIFVPLVFFALIHQVGTWSMFVLIAAALGLSAALIAVAGPRGRSQQAVA
ncbi:hypothetical protein [Bosea sp. LjRoot237]|uniref:hypothetical protein n=1 Tax=Bosea sp. LjRoot237 TaxID=3342292 RepID=UPI003ECCD9A1